MFYKKQKELLWLILLLLLLLFFVEDPFINFVLEKQEPLIIKASSE